MMDSENLIHQKISRYIEKLSRDLQVSINQNFIGSFRAGTWVEKQKVVLGFISINPHRDPEEETIDISFRTEENELLDIAIDICWSDGEILKVIIKKSLPIVSLEKAASDLDQLLQNATPIILEEVNKVIDQHLPPRYREH